MINPAQHGSQTQRGFSLVEMVVAMLISLILIAGITQIFLGSRKSYTLQNTLSRQQENGRHAADVIARDLRKAGYWGGNTTITGVTGTAPPLLPDHSCQTGDNSWARMLAQPVYGVNHTDTTALSAYACINDGHGHAARDVLVLRYASPQPADRGGDHPVEQNGRLYVRFSPTVSEQSGRLFAGQDGDKAANDMRRGQAATPAEVTSRLVARAYYIGPSGRSCDGIPVRSLYREALDKNGRPVAEEVASGIDNLQFRYGLDSNGDGSVNTYLDAGSEGLNETQEWARVVTVHFWLLTRAECPETGYTNQHTYTMGDMTYTPADNYRRQLYQSIVQLRNSPVSLPPAQLAALR